MIDIPDRRMGLVVILTNLLSTYYMFSIHMLHAFSLRLLRRVNVREFSLSTSKIDIKIDILLFLYRDYIFESCPV